MKKLLTILGVLVVASVALVPTGSALAAEITFVSVVGSWRDPVDNLPGSQPGEPVITNGDPVSSISWGTTSGPQSGYDFIATLPPPFTLPGPIPYFSLGTFQHRNFAVGDPSLVSVQLDVVLVLAVDGVPTGPLTFTFTLNHEETPNNLTPCPYPTPPGEGCTDRVTIVASAEPTTFNADGVDYTLEMSFLDNGSAVDEFITREGDTVNSSGLVGEFTLPPGLTVAKTGPATMRPAEWGNFVIDVQNASESDAHNVTLVDRLPDGPTGGMCDAVPEVLSARVFAADGVTPVPGKGPLAQGADYSLDYNGTTCELTFNTLTAASVIGVGERLVIAYRTQLDSDTQDDVTLINVAGATEWFNDDATTVYSRTLTDGTPGVGDHEDAHSVTVDLPALRFEKSVINVTTGEDPGTVAKSGETLRYGLYVENLSNVAVSNFRIVDELDRLNADPSFQAGTLNIVTLPAGANGGNTDANGGAAGTGLLDIGNLSLGGLGDSVLIEFEVILAPALANGSYVSNQSQLFDNGLPIAWSDDPNVNGAADPNVAGDEDPTRIVIEVEQPEALLKATSQPTAAIGEDFTYRITVPSVPYSEPLFDVQILDSLGASAADLELVDVTKISGPGPWTPVNSGTSTDLLIGDLLNGIDIPAGEQAVVDVTVRLSDTATNVAGLAFTNTASFSYNQLDNDDSSRLQGDSGTSASMTIVEPELTLEKSGPVQLRLGEPGAFTLDVHNIGDSPAYAVSITDLLPNATDGGMCDVAPANIIARRYDADGVTPLAPALVEGSDFTLTFAGDPACTLTIDMLTAAAAIGVDERLIVTYDAVLDADTQRDAVMTNIAGATQWFSLDVSNATVAGNARTYARLLTDGTTGTLDHEDAHTVVKFRPRVIFEKTVANLSSGENPATVATPGDWLRYTLRVENASDSVITDLAIVDELDRLNALAAFEPGTLNVVTLPAGADGSATDASGGAAGTGRLDISNLSLNGLGDSFIIELDVQLAGVIPNQSYSTNQSDLLFEGNVVAYSDDPNVNGAADPFIDGDEDPTRVQVNSAPVFSIEKISTYLTGDPAVLLAGESLRYTITVQNNGNDNANDVEIADQIPANTTYVAGSTTLNGETVVDSATGGSPLTDGLLINAPQDVTPGVMNAAVANNLATITFDVVVDPNIGDGTVLSNQAFLSTLPHGIADQPSDDPRTPIIDDPTRDIVGALPLLFAEKSAALQVDGSSPGIVDPGDLLRYTITVYNNGSAPATLVELFDDVPANTTYIADSVTLNGEPLGQPDGGAFPLAARIAISSSDLTPPLPATGEGTLSPGESAVIQFDMQVNAGVPAGTLISNQAVVYSDEVSDLLTDGDGDPATGPEPTVVVVGDRQQLAISKDVAVVDGGPALPGATLEYVVTVTNIGAVPAQFVAITDDLDAPMPGYLSYVDQSARMNGSANGVGLAGTIITADYFTEYGPLQPDQTVVLRFRAVIAAGLVDGTTVTNTARVSWDDPLRWAEGSVSIDIGGAPPNGTLSGEVWHDANHDNTFGAGVESPLQGWMVELLRDDQPVRSVLSDADGSYIFAGVAPNDGTGEAYSLRFSAPGAGIRTALLGTTASGFTDGLQRIDDIIVSSGSNLLALNMPIDPNGVVYDSLTRAPVAGATVTLLDARNGLPVPDTCFEDATQQGQVTVANGYYKFDLNFFDLACPSASSYIIDVVAPDSRYIPGLSQLIPPTSDRTTVPFDVPTCPGSANDAILATALHCEAQVSEFAPPASIPARSAETAYHVLLRLDDSRSPGSSQLFNNHVPLDPRLDGAVSVTKTSPMLNVSRGQMVPYVITVGNSFGADLQDVNLIDRFPAGFRYIAGSARFDNVAAEPAVVGRELIWSGLSLATDGRHTIKLLLAVGAGVSEGEFVNRAQAVNALTGGVMSEEASATVRLVPDPTFDCTDVSGKVFDDFNRNGYQDIEEAGLAGVRVVTARGLSATTDSYGRYHMTCAIVPEEGRGSNFVLKLDDRTLPSGYRVSTRPVQVQRATRGKALRMNFGASIYRVVGLDVADAVFEPGTTQIRQQWLSRLDLLLDELQKGPAVLRLSYVADLEPPSLVDERLTKLKDDIQLAWTNLNCCYQLVVEPEVFWRRGAPVNTSEASNR